MNNKTKLTGEQLTEKFFVEVKGWKNRGTLDYWYEELSVGGFKFRMQNLPPLHTSLDLQEEWLWPELEKIGATRSYFILYSGIPDERWLCEIYKPMGLILDFHPASTKALAQLEAALKALGVKL